MSFALAWGLQVTLDKSLSLSDSLLSIYKMGIIAPLKKKTYIYIIFFKLTY